MVDQIAKSREDIREYYGRILKSHRDLKTGACCSAEALPGFLQPLVANVHPEIRERFYGCGSPIPPVLEGLTVLDLGCGSGRDVYVLSQLVGPAGKVIGVDMTEEQLVVAERHLRHHMDRFGHARANVEFRLGPIEDLEGLGIAETSVDVVVSNCVLNLSPDKEAVFAGIFRVLKPGGELCFADVFAGRRVPEPLRHDPLLLGECLGGALYIEDFRRLLGKLGCRDHRVLARRRIDLDDPEIEAKAGMIDFHSLTVRTFKCDFEDICENYGHVALYRGTIPESPHAFLLDDHHRFPTGLPVPVCGNTAKMLGETRFGRHFEVAGDFSRHFGPFPCGPVPVPAEAGGAGGSCC